MSSEYKNALAELAKRPGVYHMEPLVQMIAQRFGMPKDRVERDIQNVLKPNRYVYTGVECDEDETF